MPIILKNLQKPHQLQLIIGNRRYSSWSLRAWLMAKQSNLTFTTKLVPFAPNYRESLSDYEHAKQVPILVDNGLVIGQSIAIGLHLHQLSPNMGIIPSDPQKAAVAFDLSIEMVSSFQNLRKFCGMDLQLNISDFQPNQDVLNDVARLEEIWHRAKTKFGNDGDYLLGEYSIVDAAFTPVATRIKTYHLKISPLAQKYCDNLLANAWFREWHDLALQEKYDYH